MNQAVLDPSHIKLQELKRLLPPVLYAAAEDDDMGEDTLDFFKDLKHYAGHAWRRSPKDQCLSKALREYVLQPLQSDGTRLGQAFGILSSAMTKIDCETCAGSKDRVCCNKPRSDSRRLHTGQCLRPIRNLFAVAESVARYYYETYAGAVTRDLQLHTVHSEQKTLHDIPIPFHVDGKTFPNGIVQLVLNGETIDRVSYRAILYVFFHECICHGFQRNLTPDGELEGCGEDDYFGEGWMDWIALDVLHVYLEECRPLLSDVEPVKRPGEVLKTGHRFHDARCDTEHQDRSKNAYSRRVGAKTAEMVLSLLQELQLEDEREWLYRLSFGLNAAGTTADQRKEFMTKLRRDLQPHYGALRKEYGIPRIAKCFEDYTQHLDAVRLCNDVRTY